MKKLLYLSLILLLSNCSSTTRSTGNTSNTTEQVFIENQTKGLPGKCYQQMTLKDQIVWTEVLCDSQVNKNLIRQMQADLTRLFFVLDPDEVAKAIFGPTTKQAIKDFQFRHEWPTED